MSRIIEDDVKRALPHQRRIAKDLSNRYNCTFIDRDDFNHIDYDITRDGEIVAYAELKNRSHDYGTYDTLFIDESKLNALRDNAEVTGKPNLLFVRFNDADYYYEVSSTERFHVAVGGRTKNYREPNDIDKVEFIPINKFTRSED